MTYRSSKPSDAVAAAAALPAGARLAPQMLLTFRALMASPQRTKILLLGVALVAVIAATAFGQIKLSAWNQPFYNAVVKRDLPGFLIQLMVFGVIAGALLVLNVAQVWLNQSRGVTYDGSAYFSMSEDGAAEDEDAHFQSKVLSRRKYAAVTRLFLLDESKREIPSS